MTSAVFPTVQNAPVTTDPPGPGPGNLSGATGTTNRGLCTLSYQGRVLRFRTNPNEIWWNYELIRRVENTYGGRVIQLLGTRLGDLTVKVECGLGGWPYLMQVVRFLRDMISDQRNEVEPAVFEYTSRNWRLGVYAVNIPFSDEVTATTREIALNFKVQEDLTGVLSQVTLNAELMRLQEGVYGPGVQPHNKYNDSEAGAGMSLADPINPGGPSYAPSGIVNLVNSMPFGSNPLGLNPLGGLPFMPQIPGLGNLSGLTSFF